jgi:hypothetical protein
MTASSWASAALGDDPVASLKTFQGGLTVNLIATDRAALETCVSDERLNTVVERNRTNEFDYLPVTEPVSGSTERAARIIGLVEVYRYMDGIEPRG